MQESYMTKTVICVSPVAIQVFEKPYSETNTFGPSYLPQVLKKQTVK